jgi:hypothetical protein
MVNDKEKLKVLRISNSVHSRFKAVKKKSQNLNGLAEEIILAYVVEQEKFFDKTVNNNGRGQ